MTIIINCIIYNIVKQEFQKKKKNTNKLLFKYLYTNRCIVINTESSEVKFVFIVTF